MDDKHALAVAQLASINQMRADPNYQEWLRAKDVGRVEEVVLARFGWALEAVGVSADDARARLVEARDAVLEHPDHSRVTEDELELWLDHDHKRLDLVKAEVLVALAELFGAASGVEMTSRAASLDDFDVIGGFNNMSDAQRDLVQGQAGTAMPPEDDEEPSPAEPGEIGG